MTPLCGLAKRYGTDKGAHHHNYTPVYYELFKDRRADVSRVLEIGIERGHSLRMWEEFFPNAHIFGFDRNPKIMINEGRIKSFLGEQDDLNALMMVGAATASGNNGSIDLIIDDGAHDARRQAATAQTLLPYLAADGVYVIEDVMRDKRDPRAKDDPSGIMGQIPAVYNKELIRTGGRSDDVLILIRWGA